MFDPMLDGRHHLGELQRDLTIRDAENGKATGLQVCRARGLVTEFMGCVVDLDHETWRKGREVDDPGADRDLTAESRS